MAFPPRDAYERFIYSLPAMHPEIQSSTLRLYSNSPTTCFVRGSIWFRSELELRVFEYLDFSDGELLNYHYTVFHGQERICWYDPQPHQEIPKLASNPSPPSTRSPRHQAQPQTRPRHQLPSPQFIHIDR